MQHRQKREVSAIHQRQAHLWASLILYSTHFESKDLAFLRWVMFGDLASVASNISFVLISESFKKILKMYYQILCI